MSDINWNKIFVGTSVTLLLAVILPVLLTNIFLDFNVGKIPLSILVMIFALYYVSVGITDLIVDQKIDYFNTLRKTFITLGSLSLVFMILFFTFVGPLVLGIINTVPGVLFQIVLSTLLSIFLTWLIAGFIIARFLNGRESGRYKIEPVLAVLSAFLVIVSFQILNVRIATQAIGGQEIAANVGNLILQVFQDAIQVWIALPESIKQIVIVFFALLIAIGLFLQKSK